MVHCAPLWLLTKHLEHIFASGVKRVIAFSSSSVSSKQQSNDSSEQILVQSLKSAEETIIAHCKANKVALTIFRPSMIYGHCRDQNITHIAKFINKYGFMILVGKASGLRQPVHADDLVNACVSVFDQQTTYNQAYYLAGAEELSYRVMVERIFNGLDKPVRILTVPLFLLRISLKLASLTGKFSYTSEMADRMRQNMNYDHSMAVKDFQYSPQVFLKFPKRDLPNN